MHQKQYQLTDYPVGSIREIWAISWPLMIGLLSSSMMMFADRVMLAHCSLSSLTAAANGGMACFVFLIAPMTISGISEVFVGQYHGHEDSKKMGVPVWQMLWMALFLAPIFIAIAFYAPQFLFQNTGNEILETQYFKIIMCFGSFFTAVPALTGYFTGQGLVKIVATASFAANFINIILGLLFIFGYGFIPSMGVRGAAIAMVIAQGFQIAIYTLFFLSKKAKRECGTNKWQFQGKIFLRCSQIGFPAGLAHTSEMLAHLAFFRIMILAGKHYIAVVSLIQSLYFLMVFIVEGLQKAVSAVASNLIGANQLGMLKKLIKASMKLHVLFFLLSIIPLIFFPREVFEFFFTIADDLLMEDLSFQKALINSSFWLACFFLLDGWLWIFIGLLTAAGDTKFVMTIGLIGQWMFYFLPIFIGIRIFHITPDKTWMLIVANTMALFLIYLWRYKSGKWKEINIRT